MENTINKHLGKLLIFATCLVLFATFLFVNRQAQIASGSTSIVDAYYATSTRNHAGTPIQSYTVIKPGAGMLGSVVITGAAAGVINIYDASTTGPHSDYATTAIAVIPASLVAGTYTFDAVATRGIVFEMVSGGTMPTTTITWK